MADREKRVRQIQQSMQILQMQLDNASGTKLVSLKNRVSQYQKEIEEFARPLSDEDIEVMIKEAEEDEL